MASVASPVERGVPPIRAGKGHSFFLRRLHSLSGIVPIGAFLLEHFISNAFATNGPNAYGAQVKFLTGLPFVPILETVGIYIPLLYHALYGFYIWFRGESNVSDYPWAGNFMYAAQRWTGGIAFVYILWHTYTMRFTGTHLLSHPDAAFDKVQIELQHWWNGVFYLVGIIAASWHFSYGIYLFCAKWGITVSETSRKWMGRACTVLALTLILVGWVTMAAFFRPQWRDHWKNPPAAEQSVEKNGIKN